MSLQPFFEDKKWLINKFREYKNQSPSDNQISAFNEKVCVIMMSDNIDEDYARNKAYNALFENE